MKLTKTTMAKFNLKASCDYNHLHTIHFLSTLQIFFELRLPEFVAVMSRKVNATYTPEEVKSAFKVFEGSSPPGFIKLATLQRALAMYGSDKLTAEQAAELLNQVGFQTAKHESL
jgi:Ca2+-binding EF-hand superfamily protein